VLTARVQSVAVFVRPRLWLVVIVGAGAVAVAVLGLSMLAADQTEQQAQRALRPWGLIATAELKAAPGLRCGSARAQLPAIETVETSQDGERQARCLHAHGFLTERQFVAVADELRSGARSPVSAWFPAGAQLDPSGATLALWTIFLLAELAAAAMLLRFRGSTRPRAT
jgi:hypothetical protein